MATIIWLVIMTVSPRGAAPQIEVAPTREACVARAKAESFKDYQHGQAWCVPLIKEK